MIVDSRNGELLVRTGVAGRAARLGHRLTIAVGEWRGVVAFDGEIPVEVTLRADVNSFAVVTGEGGLKPLSAAEKAVVRTNALRALEAPRFPSIDFHATEIDVTENGYRLHGELHVHGVAQRRVVAVNVERAADHWRLACTEKVRQSDFGVKPFSLMFGSLRVADDVTVSFSARVPNSS